MIKEAYCSDDICKLLKEKGFKEPCTALNKLVIKDGEKPFMKVTHQKAMAWLREEKNCIISIWYTGVCYASDYYIEDDNEEIHDIIGTYDTYNEAVEKSLKDVLTNLI